MKIKFTNKQKLALWGLIKYPSMNDRETADKVRIKLSTLTTIRYKMLEDKVYKTVNVPLVNRMDFELMAFFVIRMSAGPRSREIPIKKDEFPNLVYLVHDQCRVLAIGFYNDYSSAEQDLHDLVGKMRKAKMIARSGHWIRYVPLMSSEVLCYFDMSQFVNQGLGLNRPEAAVMKGSVFSGEPIHLSSFERKVMRELVAFPTETDVQLSRNLRITRSTVARIRGRLLNLAYRSVNIVDLSKLGFKAVSIAAPTLNYTFDDSSSAIIKATSLLGPPILLVVGEYGGIFMTAHKELKGIRTKTNSAFRGGPFKGHLQDPCHIATFSLKQLKVLRNHEYLPLTDQVLSMYQFRPKRRNKK